MEYKQHINRNTYISSLFSPLSCSGDIFKLVNADASWISLRFHHTGDRLYKKLGTGVYRERQRKRLRQRGWLCDWILKMNGQECERKCEKTSLNETTSDGQQWRDVYLTLVNSKRIWIVPTRKDAMFSEITRSYYCPVCVLGCDQYWSRTEEPIVETKLDRNDNITGFMRSEPFLWGEKGSARTRISTQGQRGNSRYQSIAVVCRVCRAWNVIRDDHVRKSNLRETFVDHPFMVCLFPIRDAIHESLTRFFVVDIRRELDS